MTNNVKEAAKKDASKKQSASAAKPSAPKKESTLLPKPQEPAQNVEVLDLESLSKRFETSTRSIRKEVCAVVKSFCKIGFELYKVREQKLYLGQKLDNVYDYGEKQLGFQKSSVFNYISICERFSFKKDGKPTAQLSPDFAKYSYGQLSLMLSVPTEKLLEITPDKTCKEIRGIKKALTAKKESSAKSSVSSVSNSVSAPASTPSDSIIYNVVWTYKSSDNKKVTVTRKRGDSDNICKDIFALLKNEWFDFGRDGDSISISLAGDVK